jgi:hypothetical protein
VSDPSKGNFKTAVGLLRRTTPFLLLGVLIYGGFFLGIALWLGIFGGLAYVFAERVELLALIFIFIAIVGPFAVMGLMRRYVLYLLQGAHIAVVTQMVLGRELPEGTGQVEYGRSVVKERFRDVSILFALDRMIDRTVRRFTRRFVRIVDMLPLGGAVSSIAQIGASIINRSLSYVDEAILSYAVAKDSPNVWSSARHGTILYAQAYKPVLGSAVRIWLLGRVFFLGMLLIVGIPGVALLFAFNEIWFQVVVIVGTLILASMANRMIFEPFAMIYTIVTYHRAIDGLEVNAVWDQRLQSVSSSFKKMVGKAQEHAGGTVDPLDHAQVPQQAIEGGAAPSGGTQPGAAPLQAGNNGAQQPAPSPQLSGGNPFGGMRPGRRGGIGGLVGGMVSQAAAGAAQNYANQRQQQTPPPAQQAHPQVPDAQAQQPAPPPPAQPAAPPPPAQQAPPPPAQPAAPPPPAQPAAPPPPAPPSDQQPPADS